MLQRLAVSSAVTLFLMFLVVMQIIAASEDKFLTVEQLLAGGRKGLSLDRHYAMPLDLAIIAPFVGLVIFLCWTQWEMQDMVVAATISLVLTAGFVWFWSTLPTPEAHSHGGRPTLAGILHGVFFAIAVWASILVVTSTPRPEPVLMLVMCIILPAFLFVGQHLFLGLVNFAGDAERYPDSPSRNLVGWAVILIALAGLSVRSYYLIPASFWVNLG